MSKSNDIRQFYLFDAGLSIIEARTLYVVVKIIIVIIYMCG